MLNIVIPMAGAGSRFAKAGYVLPKPLIPVLGIPMIRWVIDNVRPAYHDHRFIFIVQKAHDERFDVSRRLYEWAGESSHVIAIDGLTQGAACTVLWAADFIDEDSPLLIVNSDQWIDAAIDDFLESAQEKDGLIMTMKAHDPKWSFVEKDANDRVVRVVEKEVISDEATVGIYHFARGSDFVRSACRMIEQDERVKGEFYVAPVYNRLIAEGANIGTFCIGAENHGMYGLGIPEDLAQFEQNPIAHRMVEKFLRG